MECFPWPQNAGGPYRSALVSHENPIPLWIPDPQNNEWQWDEACSTSFITHQPRIPFGQSGMDSPSSFQSSESFPGSTYADSNFDASPQEQLLDFELPVEVTSKSAGRPRAPVSTSRDSNENRKQMMWQRRRTQNRNSQRVYRQRRLEERNLFEVRAMSAEETSAKLKSQVEDLESEVTDLTEQIRGLEMENAVLRRNSDGGTGSL